MTVRSILDSKGHQVLSVEPDAKLAAAVQVLGERKIGAVLVMSEGRVEGILSERDIVREAVRNERFFDLAVSAIMTRNVISGQSHDDVNAVATTMTSKRFRHLPVLDGDKILGVISLGDIVKAQRDEYLGAIDTLETQIIAERAS